MTFSTHSLIVNSVTMLVATGPLVCGPPVVELRRALQRLLEGGHRLFILDLSRVSDVDCAGLGALLAGRAAIGARAGRVVLLKPRERAREAMRVAGLAAVFEICDDAARAAASLTHPRARAGSGSRRWTVAS